MTETEKEIILLFRQLTPQEKRQFSELCAALNAYNAQRAETCGTAQKEVTV